jgi:hypothetical protein
MLYCFLGYIYESPAVSFVVGLYSNNDETIVPFLEATITQTSAWKQAQIDFFSKLWCCVFILQVSVILDFLTVFTDSIFRNAACSFYISRTPWILLFVISGYEIQLSQHLLVL